MSISTMGSIGDLIIPNGSNVSQVLNGVYVYHDAVALQITSPATLPDTVVLQMNPDPLATNSSSGWSDIESYVTGALASLAVPTAGKSQTYQEPISAPSLRLKASANVAADRAFKISKIWTT